MAEATSMAAGVFPLKRNIARRYLNVKLSSYGIALLYAFLLLENCFEGFLPLLGYFDEAIFFGIVFVALLKLWKNKSVSFALRTFVTAAFLLLMVCIGFIGSSVSGYQENLIAVMKDVLAFLKFPISLMCMLHLTQSWDGNETLNLCTGISKLFIVICFAFGLVNTLYPSDVLSHDVRQGITSFKFFFSHPTSLVFSLVLAFSMMSSKNSRPDAIKVMCLIVLFLTMRDKAFGFIGLVLMLWLFGIQKRRRLIPYLVIAAFVVLLIAWPKIELYLSYSNSPREAMYMGAFQLAGSFFPIGSGFGTFASSLSGEYYSGAYYALGISAMQGLSPEFHNDIGDNGIAYYVGQFGFLGTVLFALVMFLLCEEMLRRVRPKSMERFAIIVLLGYLAIALTVEATLTNSSGLSLAIVLGMIASGSDRGEITLSKCRVE